MLMSDVSGIPSFLLPPPPHRGLLCHFPLGVHTLQRVWLRRNKVRGQRKREVGRIGARGRWVRGLSTAGSRRQGQEDQTTSFSRSQDYESFVSVTPVP